MAYGNGSATDGNLSFKFHDSLMECYAVAINRLRNGIVHLKTESEVFRNLFKGERDLG